MEPVGSQLSTTLPVTAESCSVTLPPLLKIPPPWAALLLFTWLCLIVRSPPNKGGGPGGRGTPFAMPPPYPPALLWLTWLWSIVRTDGVVPGGPWA